MDYTDGIIPVMIYPCNCACINDDMMDMSDLNIMSIIEHFIKCPDCEIVNNNNKFPMSHLCSCDVVNFSKNSECFDMLYELYVGDCKYEPDFYDVSYTTLTVAYCSDIISDYYGCFLIGKY